MKATLALAAALCVAAVPAQAQVDQLGWLAGCWKSDGAEAGSGEQWMPVAGGSLLGMARTVRAGRTVAWEFMRIAANAQGQVTFFAQPSGKPPADFVVKTQDAQGIVFENPAHEFPQRVWYRLESPGKLRAAIEGQRNGQLRTIEYPMTRVACDAS